MIQSRTKQIIDSLLSATKLEKIQWSKTSQDSKYIVKVGIGSVVINKFLDSDINSFSPDMFEVVVFSILNAVGEDIEIIRLEETDSDFEYLKDFYDTVKNSYLKTDKTINSMMDFLNKLQ